MLHHLCQNNIDHTKFDGVFQDKFGLAFLCLNCMSKCMMPENINENKSKQSNNLSDIIDIEDEEKSQDKNLNGLFDDNDSSDSGTDNDVDSNDDDDSSDNDSSGSDTDDDDELDVVKLDNKGREINENPTFKSNDLNKNKDVSKSNEKLIELPKK